MNHNFIFEPQSWTGGGEITFSMVEERLPFQMRWEMESVENGLYRFHQIVEVEDAEQVMQNHFLVTNVQQESFVIELENHLVGRVKGQGVISPKAVAWEFRENEQGFEGFEIYEKTANGYKMRAEFTAGDGLRTLISGNVTEHTGS